ncbi:MAG: HEAT repeat domain-containing protein [Deltaproteobacteria bacterium]|nr:HEAT repeat domain-containing protein [Deltaproteobacteria bacterium]
MPGMGAADNLKTALETLAERHAEVWQRLPQSFDLPGPLPVKTILRIFKGSSQEVEKIYPTPQAAMEAALADGARVVLLEAGPGQGKTAALHWAMHRKCAELAQGGGEPAENLRLPWHEDLGRLEIGGDARTVLAGIVTGRPASLREGAGLFYLDGLDLLTGQPDPSSLVKAAEKLTWETGHAFVFSSRPLESVRGGLADAGKSCRLELAGLDREAVADWLQNCEARRPGAQKAFDQICQASQAAEKLIETPLLFAMALSAALATAGGQEPLNCGAHPGRAGLFAGFVDHFIIRAKGQTHLPGGYRGYSGEAFNGLCWAALAAGHMETIPGKERGDLLPRAAALPGGAGPPEPLSTAAEAAARSEAELRQAGIVSPTTPDCTVGFIHQEFMEHLGGRHLARRLRAARQGGWLEAELWDHLGHERLDSLLAHGLAQLGDADRRAIMGRAFDLPSFQEIPKWIGLLATADPAIAFDLVSPFVNSPDPSARARAAGALGKINDPRSVEPLREILRDEEGYVRQAAAWALGELNDPRAEGALLEALRDEDVSVHAAAFGVWARGSDPPALGPLLKALRDEEGYVRRAAAEALGELKDPRAVEPLLKALRDEDADVRVAAAEALGELNDPRAVEPLREALEDEEEYVRQATAGALGGLKDPRALEPLLKALEDDNKDVRRSAAEALGGLKDPRALGPLLKTLGDEDAVVRWAAARALGELKDPRSVEPLLKALKDEHFLVRLVAAGALAAIFSDMSPDPMDQLTAHSPKISDESAVEIAAQWQRRWPG